MGHRIRPAFSADRRKSLGVGVFLPRLRGDRTVPPPTRDTGRLKDAPPIGDSHILPTRWTRRTVAAVARWSGTHAPRFVDRLRHPTYPAVGRRHEKNYSGMPAGLAAGSGRAILRRHRVRPPALSGPAAHRRNARRRVRAAPGPFCAKRSCATTSRGRGTPPGTPS